METENIIQILIMTHVVFGSIALISGAISMITKKGDFLHKKSGTVFYYALLMATIISFIISSMPNHKSPFLFFLGLFTLYFIIGGYRSLRFKEKNASFWIDKIIAYTILFTGVFMMTYPILFEGKINSILLVFGAVGILFGIVDLLLFQNLNTIKKNWLKIHLSKMISGYVATVTAFIVNQWNFGIWSWFTPTIFGNIFIVYWLIKLNRKKL